MTKVQENILDELESFHENKLSELRAKRAGHSTLNQPRELVIGGLISLKIDPQHRKVILSWDR
ncbi:MAG: hypothetical protein M3Q07_07530 [Pseudobdellovibrionaceae bacterium]|nr:hypothetical protein [Pseudobdellovibrionaceae bacterium]